MAEWRDSYAQRQYREYSRSQNKDSQHASHQISIDVARYIDSHVPGRTAQANIDAVNSFSNFYMKDAYTNQSTDNRLDAGIMRKFESGEPLSYAETARARIQAREFQTNTGFTDAYWSAARDLYRGLQSSDGYAIWDDRRN